MANPYQQQGDSYRKTQIDTASPEALVLMLYDGALRFMTQAEAAFEAGNKELISNSLLRVQAIFTELLAALDKDKGGEIAVNLELLYIFFLEKLGEANVQKEVKPLQEIRPLVEEMRQTWDDVIKVRLKESQGPTSPTKPRLNLAV